MKILENLTTKEISPSLDFYTYIEHAKGLKMAADENVKLFFENNEMPMYPDEVRIKGNGLFNSSMLLYAVSIELILKARALYEKREDMANNDEIKTFLNKFYVHSYNQIIEHYKIDLTIEEKNILNDLQEYTIWAGRFPFPKETHSNKDYVNGKEYPGKLSLEYIDKIESLIEKQIKIMVV